MAEAHTHIYVAADCQASSRQDKTADCEFLHIASARRGLTVSGDVLGRGKWFDSRGIVFLVWAQSGITVVPTLDQH